MIHKAREKSRGVYGVKWTFYGRLLTCVRILARRNNNWDGLKAGIQDFKSTADCPDMSQSKNDRRNIPCHFCNFKNK
jgi:hypothetical protein